MATLRCKKCGGDLNIIDTESSICECEYCGSRETIPTIDDEKIIKLYDRANRFRMASEFDKAAGVYEGIVEESDTEAEAYWGLVLCKYGIEYVDDPTSGEKIPTCHRLSFDSVMEDSDFEHVMENADMFSRNVYRENAKQIEEIRRGIIEVSDKEEPYDIFICYKETDENGDRTIDSVLAQNVYDALTDKGYRVFFARITLEDKLGQEYEPYIFAALNSAKIMLAFGTSYDYYNAVWVKNEWSRYLKLMAKDKTKKLIPCYKDIDAYDIPTEFKHFQAQDMGKVGADQDLIRGIDKILRPEENGASVATTKTSNNMDVLLERGFMTLEDGDFDKADDLFESVLNQNPKCAEAYMGKLWAYYKSKNLAEFASLVIDHALCDFKETEIKPDYDIKNIIRTKYMLSAEVSESIIDAIQEDFSFKYKTNIEELQAFDATKDYVEVFCSLDNELTNSSTQLDDRYYSRYLQYATDETSKKFNIGKQLEELVSLKIDEEKTRIDSIEKLYSREGIEKLLETANENLRPIVGDDLARIEDKYQKELQEWEENEKKKKAAYEEECKRIKEKWPAKSEEDKKAWEAECKRLTAEYNARKEEYELEVARVEKHNNNVINLQNKAKEKYEIETRQLDTQISSMKAEVAGLGFFKKKQKEAINQNIRILESRRKSLEIPDLKAFGDLLKSPEALEPLQLPKAPQIAELPTYPEKPVESKKPVRDKLHKRVDAVEELIEVFLYNDIECEKMILVHNWEKIGVYKNGFLELGVGADKKPLQWIILSGNKNEALIMTKDVIDVKQYWNKWDDIKWEQSLLRTYLNDSFIKETFSDEVQKKILKVTLKNSDDNSQKDTMDSVFCLSVDEVNTYFKNDKDRMAIPTQYAIGKVSIKDMLFFVDTKEKGARWWLRSSADGEKSAAYVRGDGSVNTHGTNVDADYIGIRPALWIKLSNGNHQVRKKKHIAKPESTDGLMESRKRFLEMLKLIAKKKE